VWGFGAVKSMKGQLEGGRDAKERKVESAASPSYGLGG